MVQGRDGEFDMYLFPPANKSTKAECRLSMKQVSQRRQFTPLSQRSCPLDQRYPAIRFGIYRGSSSGTASLRGLGVEFKFKHYVYSYVEFLSYTCASTIHTRNSVVSSLTCPFANTRLPASTGGVVLYKNSLSTGSEPSI